MVSFSLAANEDRSERCMFLLYFVFSVCFMPSYRFNNEFSKFADFGTSKESQVKSFFYAEKTGIRELITLSY